jgi:hypothetical protein
MKILVSSISYRNHVSLIVYNCAGGEDPYRPVTEIHGDTRKKMAIALFSNYPHELTLAWGGLECETCCEVLVEYDNPEVEDKTFKD